MKVDLELLRKVAKNARISLTPQEEKVFLPQLEEIFAYFERLNSLDTSDVKPSFHPTPLKQRFRDDKVEPSLTQEQALSSTEHKKDGYFRGPKAI